MLTMLVLTLMSECCPSTLKLIKSTVILDMRSKGQLLSKFHYSCCVVRIFLKNKKDKIMHILQPKCKDAKNCNMEQQVYCSVDLRLSV